MLTTSVFLKDQRKGQRDEQAGKEVCLNRIDCQFAPGGGSICSVTETIISQCTAALRDMAVEPDAGAMVSL